MVDEYPLIIYFTYLRWLISYADQVNAYVPEKDRYVSFGFNFESVRMQVEDASGSGKRRRMGTTRDA